MRPTMQSNVSDQLFGWSRSPIEDDLVQQQQVGSRWVFIGGNFTGQEDGIELIPTRTLEDRLAIVRMWRVGRLPTWAVIRFLPRFWYYSESGGGYGQKSSFEGWVSQSYVVARNFEGKFERIGDHADLPDFQRVNDTYLDPDRKSDYSQKVQLSLAL